MLNFDDYRNNLPYPIKANFTTTYWYKAGETVASKGPDGELMIFMPGIGVTLSTCVKEDVLDSVAFHAAQVVYSNETGRLEMQFKKDFFAELGIENNPKRDMLYSVAWSMGHSAGYGDVMSYGFELVDLIED